MPKDARESKAGIMRKDEKLKHLLVATSIFVIYMIICTVAFTIDNNYFNDDIQGKKDILKW